MVPNCPRCQIVRFWWWCQIVRCQIVLVPNCPRCQIVRGAKLSWCQIVRGAKLSAVPNCPRCQIVRCQIVRCQIVRGAKLSAVPNCPVPNCPIITLTTTTQVWVEQLPVGIDGLALGQYVQYCDIRAVLQCFRGLPSATCFYNFYDHSSMLKQTLLLEPNFDTI